MRHLHLDKHISVHISVQGDIVQGDIFMQRDISKRKETPLRKSIGLLYIKICPLLFFTFFSNILASLKFQFVTG